MAKSILTPGLRATIRAQSPDAFARELTGAREWQPSRFTSDWEREYRTAVREFLETEATRRIRFAHETLETLGMAGRRAA